jgi:hypothetical protein
LPSSNGFGVPQVEFDNVTNAEHLQFRGGRYALSPASPSASESGTNARRRGFLLALGAGGAGAAALAARSLSGIAVQEDGASADESKGYQVTDHVKRYYRTAKI